MKKIVVTLLGGVIFFGVLTFLSQNSLPGSSLYNFKRVYEKILYISTTQMSEKVELQLLNVVERFDELRHVTKSNHPFILSSSLRYSTTVGEATQFIIMNNLSKEAIKIQRLLKVHKKLIEYSAVNYNGHGGNALFLSDAVNYITINQQNLADFCKDKGCKNY